MAEPVFYSLVEAIKAGYQITNKTQEGYDVKQRVNSKWITAKVIVRTITHDGY